MSRICLILLEENSDDKLIEGGLSHIATRARTFMDMNVVV
jgi:hypothetical protein